MKYIENVFTDPFVLLRSHLLDQGVSRGHIDYSAASGRWIRVHRGVYVDAAAPDLTKSLLRAHLVACGPEAALSHTSAAVLHNFDSTHGYGLTTCVTAPRNCGVHGNNDSGAIGLSLKHSSMLSRPEVVEGFPVTSRARTLLDLAATMCDVECERVLESALRGADPKRPDLWRNEVLGELHALLQIYPRHRGAACVRRVLRLRAAQCRPTGSFPETVLFQALRDVGIVAIRQPTLTVIDKFGKRFRYFPDLLVVAGKCVVEVDGGGHLDAARARSDLLDKTDQPDKTDLSGSMCCATPPELS
jgi:hypothetical protein